MDVTDADLLALAGDDSSDEGTTPAFNATTKAISPVPPISRSVSHTKDTSPTINNSTLSTSNKLAGGKRAKKTRKDDSEEEGEAYVVAGCFEYLTQRLTLCPVPSQPTHPIPLNLHPCQNPNRIPHEKATLAPTTPLLLLTTNFTRRKIRKRSCLCRKYSVKKF